MREMVTRVAKALFLSEHPNAEWSAGRARAKWFTMAEAAIEAMREPTPRMIAATAVQTHPASEQDYRLAQAALRFLPSSDHPDVADILADVARDHRAMMDAAVSWDGALDGVVLK